MCPIASVPIDYWLIIHVSRDSDCQLACRYALGALKTRNGSLWANNNQFRSGVSQKEWVPIIDGNGNIASESARVLLVNY